MSPRVAQVVPEPDHTLVLTFSNGEVRRFDARPILGYPVFCSLREPSELLRARVDHGTVVWGEDVDLCPDTLYELSEKIEGG
jgi:hypothetical protein